LSASETTKKLKRELADAGNGSGSSAGDGNRLEVETSLRFVHLHAQSSFSLLESALPVATLIELAKADNQPALAMTDRNNLFGALEFSEKASAAGLQPVMGTKLAVDFGNLGDKGALKHAAEFPFLVLLACNETGFRNLSRLSSGAHLDTDGGALPHVSVERLDQCSDGLICLTGGNEGPVNRSLLNNKNDDAEKALKILLLSTASGATWVSLHHGGGVGMGYSQHAGLVIVADGSDDAARRIARVLWNDPASGVMRHADAGYDAAVDCARENGLDLPMMGS